MNTVCLYTQSSRLSQRWEALLSSKYQVKECRAFEDLKSSVGENSYVLFHDDADEKSVIEALDALHAAFPKNNTLVLRSQPSLEEGELFLSHDIGGYGNANMSDDVLMQAVEVVSSGNIWLYPELMQHVVQRINAVNGNKAEDLLKGLTDREKEVALLVAKGESNQMIAQDLDISQNTVKLHIASIFEKLGLKSRVALALLVSKAG